MNKQLSRAADGESKTAANSSLFSLQSSLQIVDRNAHRLLELVNQQLDFRKVESRTLEMTFAPQNVRQLLMTVCERFAPTFEQGGKQFTVNYPDDHFTATYFSKCFLKQFGIRPTDYMNRKDPVNDAG